MINTIGVLVSGGLIEFKLSLITHRPEFFFYNQINGHNRREYSLIHRIINIYSIFFATTTQRLLINV